MVYTPATKLPDLELFRWGTPDSPNPRLATPLLRNSTATTIKFTSPPLGYDGSVISGATLIGVKNNQGYSEIIFVPAGGFSVDGLTATGCVRGIRPNGLDFTTGDDDYIAEHQKDSPVCCAVSAVYNEIVKSALRGELATNGSNFIIGTDADGTITISRSTGVGTYVGFLRWNTSNDKTEYSNNGSVWNTFDSVTASNLVIVSNDDTTPGDLEAKVVAGTNVSLATLSPGANEQRQISVPATNLANIVSDVTATATEINQVTDGVSANVTATNLNTLTAGSTSNADALHTHAILGPYSFTTAEAINGSVTPKAVSRLGTNAVDFFARRAGNNANALLDYGDGADIDLTFGDVDASTRRATPFTYTNTLPTTISLVRGAFMLEKTASPSDNVVVALQADSGGNPSGTDIATQTFSGSDLVSNFHVIEFSFSGANLTSGNQYWIVVRRSGANDAVNYYRIRSSGSAGTAGKVFRASTTTWSNGDAFQMYLTIGLDYDGGEIALADSSSSYLGNFIGFTKSNVAGGATAAVQTQGVVTGFTGLTPNEDYYLQTSGDISTSPSNIRVGWAKSATELMIEPSFGLVQGVVSNTYTSKPRENNSVSGQSFKFVLLTGFKPNFVSWSDSLNPSVASEIAFGWTENYRGQTRAIQRISALDSSARTVNSQSLIANDTGTFTSLNSYYDNGFELSYSPSLAQQQYSTLNYRANRI